MKIVALYLALALIVATSSFFSGRIYELNTFVRPMHKEAQDDGRRLSCVHGYLNGVVDTKYPKDGGVAALKGAAKFCRREYKDD